MSTRGAVVVGIRWVALAMMAVTGAALLALVGGCLPDVNVDSNNEDYVANDDGTVTVIQNSNSNTVSNGGTTVVEPEGEE